MYDYDRIEASARARGIRRLVHFTRASNLPTILQYGLVPRVRFFELGLDPDITDPARIDRYNDSVSISISFPNYKMFYPCRGGNESNHDWVVVLLEPSILWTLPCAFCRHNASDGRMLRVDTQDLMTHEAFEGMFGEISGKRARYEMQLESFEPTDVQAEVLVFGGVAPAFIREVATTNLGLQEYCQGIHPEVQWIPARGSGWVYGPRHDFRFG